MNQGTIRQPRPTDIEEIIRIWLDGNMHAHPFIQPDYWLNHIGYMREALPQAGVYIYEQDGNIAGFIGLQGRHIAGLFIDKFIKQKHLSLTLTVYRKNDKALQFYQKHNFVAVEERVDTNNNEVELLMRWDKVCPNN